MKDKECTSNTGGTTLVFVDDYDGFASTDFSGKPICSFSFGDKIKAPYRLWPESESAIKLKAEDLSAKCGSDTIMGPKAQDTNPAYVEIVKKN